MYCIWSGKSTRVVWRMLDAERNVRGKTDKGRLRICVYGARSAVESSGAEMSSGAAAA